MYQTQAQKESSKLKAELIGWLFIALVIIGFAYWISEIIK
jgi:nitrate reductase NapE component